MIVIKIIGFFILYLFLFILLLTLILLVSPIKGHVKFDISNVNFKGSYLFGLLKVRIKNKDIKVSILGFKLKTSGKKKKDDLDLSDIDEKKVKKEKKGNKEKKKYGIPDYSVISLTLKLIKKLIKRIAPKHLYVKLTLGIDDPYYIGMTKMVFDTLVFPINRIRSYHLIFQPVYDDIAIDFEGEGDISFSLISLIAPCIIFIFKKPIRRYLGLFKFKKRGVQ